MSELTNLLPKAGTLSKTGWELPSAMSESEWKEAGAMLAKVEGAMNWWLGDWWAFGEHGYGDRKALVESDEWEGPAYETCKWAGSICKTFARANVLGDETKPIRRELPTFRHHAECASLPAEESDRKNDITPRLYFSVNGVPHKMRLDEWGCHEFIRKNRSKLGAVDMGRQLTKNLKLDDSNYEHLFFIGNLNAHRRAWIVISVISRKISKQVDLF